MMKRVVIFTLVLMLTALSAHAAGDGAPEPVRLAKSVDAGLSTVAWSPEGSRIAYISGRLYIATIDGQRIKSPLKNAYFVSWLTKDTMLALSRDGNTAVASLLDAAGEVIKQSALPLEPTTAYAAGEGFDSLLLTTETTSSMSIGERTNSALYSFKTATGEHREVFSYDRIHLRQFKGVGFIMGWSGAGPSPLTGEFALLEYVDPPALNPYARLVAVDPITGKGMHLFRAPLERLMFGAGWSARGDMLAVADLSGTLRLISIDGLSNVPDETIKGTYASWSPSADRICFGAHLINPDGSDKVRLAEGSEGSRCFWRPGGEDIALLKEDGTLWLMSAVARAGFPEDRAPFDPEVLDKIRLLRDLLSEGLIDEDDYSARFTKLTGIGRPGR